MRLPEWIKRLLGVDRSKEGECQILIGRYYNRVIEEAEANALLNLSPEEAAKKPLEHKLRVLRFTSKSDYGIGAANYDTEDLRRNILQQTGRLKHSIPGLQVRFVYDESQQPKHEDGCCNFSVQFSWQPGSLKEAREQQGVSAKLQAMVAYYAHEHRLEARDKRGLEIGWHNKGLDPEGRAR